LQTFEKDHYAALGLDRRCTLAQIRAAYRLLAKRHHPDLNSNSVAAVRRTQELNSARSVLSDAELRAAYDRELDAPKHSGARPRTANIQRNIAKDVPLRLEDFLRGAKREVHVLDPANPGGAEIYELVIPPGTVPGTRFSLPRSEPFGGGFVRLRVKPQPHFRFKVRGLDLRIDLRIKPELAARGGVAMICGLTGAKIRVQIPRGVAPGEIVCIAGEGLPGPRGGRGDLLVRINYRIEVRIRRPGK